MKTCLQLFHHSTFDDGLSPARKVNVELTYVMLCLFILVTMTDHPAALVEEVPRARIGGRS